MINPSGFRWAEVRTALRERLGGAGRLTAGLVRLTRNLRSARGLVELANEVLAWKRERTGRSEGDEPEEPVVAGATPIHVEGGEEALAAVVAGSGPGAPSWSGPRRQGAGSRRSWTPRGFSPCRRSRASSFDVVVLWGVLAADPEPWRRLLPRDSSIRPARVAAGATEPAPGLHPMPAPGASPAP